MDHVACLLQVENVMGTNRFVTVYVLAGMAGNILSCMVNPRTPVSYQPARTVSY